MITLVSSIVVGLVLTVCDDNTNQCNIYVPATYETKVLASEMQSPNNGAQLTIEQGKTLCRNEFKDLINDVMSENNKVFVLDAECKVIQPSNTKG